MANNNEAVIRELKAIYAKWSESCDLTTQISDMYDKANRKAEEVGDDIAEKYSERKQDFQQNERDNFPVPVPELPEMGKQLWPPKKPYSSDELKKAKISAICGFGIILGVLLVILKVITDVYAFQVMAYIVFIPCFIGWMMFALLQASTYNPKNMEKWKAEFTEWKTKSPEPTESDDERFLNECIAFDEAFTASVERCKKAKEENYAEYSKE